MSNFGQAEADALFSAIRSAAKKLGVFSAVIGHEPVNAPPSGVACSVSLGPVKPVTSSGLGAVSGQVTILVHLWAYADTRPLDDLDPRVLGATCALMGAFSGGFTLGGTVRDVDLFGMDARPGYARFEGKEYRVMTITLPVEVNDMFEEAS